MNTTPPPYLHTSHGPANVEDVEAADSPIDPNALVATLLRIGAGAAADGHAWPEHHPLHGRRLALADADCTLAGLRVVQEVLLAAERTRQNAGPEQYVGDRVMEGLMQACLGLTAHAMDRLQPG